MNRTCNEKFLSIVKRPVAIYGVFNVGAAGAVTLQQYNYPTFGAGPNARTYTAAPVGPALPASSGQWPAQYRAGSEGIYSVVRTGTGLWTITFQDNYQRLIGLSCFTRKAGGVATISDIAENTTISSMANGSGSIVGLTLLNGAAAAADPASGDQLVITFEFQDATEP